MVKANDTHFSVSTLVQLVSWALVGSGFAALTLSSLGLSGSSGISPLHIPCEAGTFCAFKESSVYHYPQIF